MAAFSQLKAILNLAFALEMLSVGLIQYTFYDAMRSELIYNSLNTLINYIHDNCLNFLELIYYQLKACDSKDTSVAAIHTILINRKGAVSKKSEIGGILQGRNGAIMKVINKVMKLKTGTKLFGNTSSKVKKERSIQSLLSKVLNDIDAGSVELKLVYESIRSIAKELPRTVVKQGPISLPVVKSPFLPPLKDGSETYTLVLDLDETLVHYCDVSFTM